MKLKKLNYRELLFCHEYTIDLNGTQAAIRAGYSEKSARVTASKLLTKANILEQIKSETDKLFESADIEAWMIIKELKKLAFGEPGTVINSDKFKALESLGKYLGMFNDKLKIEHSGEIERPFDPTLTVTISPPPES